MLDQSSRHLAYAAGSMHSHGRTIVFDCIDDHGRVTLSVIVDEAVLASGIARVIAGLALLAGDHAELAELHAAHSRHDSDHAAETFPEHAPGTSSAVVPLRSSPAVPFELLHTSTGRAADQLPQLPARPSPHPIQYRDEPVAHHGGQYVAPGRRVVAGTWRYPSPEVCRDDRTAGVWIGPPDRTSQQALVCVSCGLDGT
ncbi:hypothetical protein [Dactylosporangium sp. NPDC048998]|uniref:hypothetical protein n=1 Tax=Dactylosporangium sp. NPDC048998 TaxID=3363976 RepID=UPI0037112720